jgi:hypothetical protein
MINNLDLLINKLNNKNLIYKCSLYEYYDILKKYNGNDWKKYIDTNSNNIYIRKCLYNNHNYSLWLLSWYKNNETNIHNHMNHGCIFKILNGELLEYNYTIVKNDLIKYDNNLLNNKSFFSLSEKLNILNNGITIFKNKYSYHKIVNKIENTYSLHLYGPE